MFFAPIPEQSQAGFVRARGHNQHGRSRIFCHWRRLENLPDRVKPLFLWLFLVPARENPRKMRRFCYFSTGASIKIAPAFQHKTQPFKRGGFMAAGLTKTQLVRHLAEKTELNNKTAAAFLEHLADTAIKETKKNGVFVVPGIGRLVKAHRKARVGRNPQTGEPIQIKAKTVVKFRVAKAAKDAIAPKK
jgi:DNA-binding protein HU-beta